MWAWFERKLTWFKRNPGKVQQDGITVYRVRNSYLAVGLAGGLVSTAMGVVSVIVAWGNADGSFRYPRATAVGLGIFWSGFVALAAYIVWAYCRERLFVGALGIRQRGCFRTKTMKLSDVTRLQWRADKSVKLWSSDGKIVVHLDNFSPDEREELIHYFRGAVEEARQQKWSQFESLHISPPPVRKRGWTGHLLAATILFGIATYLGFSGLFGKPRLSLAALVIAAAGIQNLWMAWKAYRQSTQSAWNDEMAKPNPAAKSSLTSEVPKTQPE